MKCPLFTQNTNVYLVETLLVRSFCEYLTHTIECIVIPYSCIPTKLGAAGLRPGPRDAGTPRQLRWQKTARICAEQLWMAGIWFMIKDCTLLMETSRSLLLVGEFTRMCNCDKALNHICLIYPICTYARTNFPVTLSPKGHRPCLMIH